ncbi:porin [Paraflavisolibacter sp. H34]|uniref:porin n=1 Tax=Huijunlia imazamoxiresistens TaxID=3127457 RepID=UPI00301B5913
MKKLFTAAGLLLGITSLAQDSSRQHREAAGPLTVNGHVEAYYSYDFNRPASSNRPGFLYNHSRHNEFTVNLAYLKGSYTTARARVSLALGAGTYMNANYAAERGTMKNMYEGSAGYKLLRDQTIWLDIGVLPSHIGFESAHSPSCWTLTRSMAAENSPYYEAGARLTYHTPDSNWLFAALALNGWQRIQREEGNSLPGWGTQVLYTPGSTVSLNYSTFWGTPFPDSSRKWRSFHNLYGIFHLSRRLGLILDFDMGWEQQAKGSRKRNNWYTPVAILRYMPSDQWAVALRGEYYHDRKGVIISTGTPHGFQTTGFSANIDYRPARQVVLRLEVRALNSRDKIFEKEGLPQQGNTALTFSSAISF